MTWIMYRVEFDLLSPLHIGYVKHGNVQYTRRYVPGKTIWGALTARLTRDHNKDTDQYQQVGQLIQEKMAFSYFYFVDKGQDPLWPWQNEEHGEFAWRYLHTYAATALDPKTKTAEQSSLHETEYIAPITRDANAVSLRGYLFVQEDLPLPWQTALQQLQLGGERTYGWGRVKLTALCPLTAEQEFWPKWHVKTNGSRPQLISNEEKNQIYAHMAAEKSLKMCGNLEPLIGRETAQNNHHGQQLSAAKICWMPGSQICQAPVLEIGYNGIWQLTA